MRSRGCDETDYREIEDIQGKGEQLIKARWIYKDQTKEKYTRYKMKISSYKLLCYANAIPLEWRIVQNCH